MLKKMSHTGATTDISEIQFATRFGYMFPELTTSAECLLPAGQDTTRGLLALGDAIASDTGAATDSTIPSFFTYFGQFIDHDLTARTDRETGTSEVFAPDGGALPVTPRNPVEVSQALSNGRRPQLDLDSVYGDGPALAYDGSQPPGTPVAGGATEAQALYDADLKFHVQKFGTALDLPRDAGNPNPRTALIADMRNDENVNVSQLHAAFLSFHNAVMDGLATEGVTGVRAYVQARQYVRWTYQYLVVEKYLRTVCMNGVVEDVLRNGPIFYGLVAGGLPLFMPLEFSAAAFRFAHSMVRPKYQLSGTELTIEGILGVSTPLRPTGAPDLLDEPMPGHFRLKSAVTVNWHEFVDAGGANKARKIDTRLAQGLGELTFVGQRGSVMAHLAKRNLLRGFSLSIPTGQAIAAACGIQPLSPNEIRQGEDLAIKKALDDNGFASRTPLWYYVLREAAVQADGDSLGLVGSRIVAETIVGLLKKDPNSYLNQFGIARNIKKKGIVVPTPAGRRTVGTVEALLTTAGVYS